MSGWIKLHKRFTSHWLYEKKPFTQREAWIDLLLHSNYKEGKKEIKGQLVPYKRGQQLRSQVKLSAAWGWSRDRTRRFLEKLEDDGMIIQQNTQLTTIISICNFEEYQGNTTADDTTNDTAGNTTLTTADDTQLRSKDLKKLKKSTGDLLDFSSWPEKPTDEILTELKQHRKSMKQNKLTQRVVNTLGKNLTILKNKGVSVEQGLGVMFEKEWKGMEADWVINHLRISDNKSDGAEYFT